MDPFASNNYVDMSYILNQDFATSTSTSSFSPSNTSHLSRTKTIIAWCTGVYAAGFFATLVIIHVCRRARRRKRAERLAAAAEPGQQQEAPPPSAGPMKSPYVWVPDVFRREMCLRPLYPLMVALPCLLWPLLIAAFVLCIVYFCLFRLLAPPVRWLLRTTPPTTLCGMPMTRLQKSWRKGMERGAARRAARRGRAPDADVEARAGAAAAAGAGQQTTPGAPVPARPAPARRAPSEAASEMTCVEGMCISEVSSREPSRTPSRPSPAWLASSR